MLHVEDEPAEIVAIAHDDETGPAMVELLLDAANHLVDELITRPRQTSALWDKLPETVKTQIEHAKGQADA
ncbi:hypothetical protein SAMN05216266_120103 [Amycolatopsis marina]|uniref:Uncharacterized protein n=2 Tax=Amycolatopsis marina TaxID=490629 RepID=A0A1I1C4R4_9PSEU|nr:hypothetical protein SAMN05216266_120103 [Amycolatopsis marina]